MDDQIMLSRELLTTMRTAVNHAIADASPFVAAAHVLLALIDDPELTVTLSELLDRENIMTPPRHVERPQIVRNADPPVDGQRAPFVRYDTLAFRSCDGRQIRWLDREAHAIFIEGARRTGDDPYRPKHLALGFLAVTVKTRDVLKLLGPDPDSVRTAVYAL